MPEIVAVMCHIKCEGIKNLCLPDIKIIVEDGDIAYMLYSEHLIDKVKAYGYKVIAQSQHNIPIGMYIMLQKTEFPIKI